MQKSKNFFKILILSMVLGLGVSYIYAWTNPTGEPPAGNVAAPLNVSGNAQTFSGNKIFRMGSDGLSGLGIQGSLDVNGIINASQDICTDLNGGVCLSTATSTVVSGSGSSGEGFKCTGTCPLLTAE